MCYRNFQFNVLAKILIFTYINICGNKKVRNQSKFREEKEKKNNCSDDKGPAAGVPQGVIDFYCKKNLDFCIDIFKSIITFAVANANRGVAQLAARHVRDVEVGSSSLLTPTEIRLILSGGFFVFSQCHRHGATSRHGARRRDKKNREPAFADRFPIV